MPSRQACIRLTERQWQIHRDLVALDRKRWVKPQDIGGFDGSHHSAALRQLVTKGLVERRPRNTLLNFLSGGGSSWEYRATPAWQEVRLMVVGARLVAKWNARWEIWHWCEGYRGPTLCGIRRLRSIGECEPTPKNPQHQCRKCAKARVRRESRGAPC